MGSSVEKPGFVERREEKGRGRERRRERSEEGGEEGRFLQMYGTAVNPEIK